MWVSSSVFSRSNAGLQSQGLLDDTTTAQIDTLILDNRKKLNDIIGELNKLLCCQQP